MPLNKKQETKFTKYQGKTGAGECFDDTDGQG